MNFKMHLRKVSLTAYFKGACILHYFGLNSLSGSTGDRRTELKPVSYPSVTSIGGGRPKEPILCGFPSRGGDSLIKVTGMRVGKFKLNP